MDYDFATIAREYLEKQGLAYTEEDEAQLVLMLTAVYSAGMNSEL